MYNATYQPVSPGQTITYGFPKLLNLMDTSSMTSADLKLKSKADCKGNKGKKRQLNLASNSQSEGYCSKSPGCEVKTNYTHMYRTCSTYVLWQYYGCARLWYDAAHVYRNPLIRVRQIDRQTDREGGREGGETKSPLYKTTRCILR